MKKKQRSSSPFTHLRAAVTKQWRSTPGAQEKKAGLVWAAGTGWAWGGPKQLNSKIPFLLNHANLKNVKK